MNAEYAAPLVAFDEISFLGKEEFGSDPRAIGFEAVKKVVPGDNYLSGHYPGFTIYPGVFTIETVYQAARDVLSRGESASMDVSLSGIRSVRFKAPILPGDVLRCVCEATPVDDTEGCFLVKARCEHTDGTLSGTVSLEVRVGGSDTRQVDGVPPTSVPGSGALGPAEITSLLPHRHPILQVDRALETEPGRSIVTTKAVTSAEPCYAGVPAGARESSYDYPMSLLFESVGQSGAVLWFDGQKRTTGGGEVLLFGGARGCRRLGPVRPGDVMRHAVRIETVKGENAVMSAQTWVEDRCVATVDSMIAVVRSRADLAGG